MQLRLPKKKQCLEADVKEAPAKLLWVEVGGLPIAIYAPQCRGKRNFLALSQVV